MKREKRTPEEVLEDLDESFRQVRDKVKEVLENGSSVRWSWKAGAKEWGGADGYMYGKSDGTYRFHLEINPPIDRPMIEVLTVREYCEQRGIPVPESPDDPFKKNPGICISLNVD